MDENLVAGLDQGDDDRPARQLAASGLPGLFFRRQKRYPDLGQHTKAYFDELLAPKKNLFLFERSGHQIHKDEPEKLQQTIISTL